MRQMKLPLPRQGKAELLASVRDRLYGYELRQAAREAKRRRTARKRKERALRHEQGMVESDPQLPIPGFQRRDR